MTRRLPLATKGTEIFSVVGFLLTSILLLPAFFFHVLCVRNIPGFSHNIRDVACHLDNFLWPLVGPAFRGIGFFILLFFVAALTRYINFANWHHDFQAAFKVTDDHIILMARNKAQGGFVEDMAKTMYRQYRMINPLFGSGKEAVAAHLFGSGVAALIFLAFVSARLG